MAISLIMVAVAAIILLVAWSVWRTARLNSDPLQHDLANLLAELLSSEFSETGVAIFEVSKTNRFVAAFVLSNREQQTRLAHALSLLRPNLTTDGYEALKQYLRVTT